MPRSVIPRPSLFDAIRPGDNRWTESLVALDVNTGKLVWGYQYVPHDPWDLDAVSPPILADVAGADGTIPGVIHGGKTGWVYVHDRATGKLLRRSENMIPHENSVHAADRGGSACCPARMAASSGRRVRSTRTPAWSTTSTCISR